MSLEQAREHVVAVEESSRAVAKAAELLKPPPLERQPWFETLQLKVRPQLEENRFLIVAVVGGTNIGKSAVFNHIAGEAASTVDRRAAGTKHPVLLVPQGFEGSRLGGLFPSFVLRPWESEQDPIRAADDDLLFWRTSAATPSTLLVLDTPDVDSDQPANWERADRVRRAADVLVCVLTQQKYNDQAIKEFFRRAAAEGKQTIVVFNQVELPQRDASGRVVQPNDEDIWAEWVGGFCNETGLEPQRVYLAPYDREAVAELRLPFHARQWPPQPLEQRLAGPADEPRSLLADLSELHFETIKLATMEGALRQVASEGPRWLEEVRAAAGAFAEASEELRTHQLANVRDWPQLPAAVMTQELMTWWRSQREGVTKKVHSFYSGVTSAVVAPFKKLARETEDPLETYRRREWNDGVQPALEQVFERLSQMERSGHERLRPLLEGRLNVATRQRVLREMRAAHDAIDFEAELTELVVSEMTAFKDENASLFSTVRNLDRAAAAARPLITAGLFFVGAGPLVDVGAAGTMTHIVGEVAGGAATTVVGEGVIEKVAPGAVGKLQARIQALHAKFAAKRLAWLSSQLREQLLGDLITRVQSAAELPRADVFTAAETALAELQSFLQQEFAEPVAA